MASRVFNPHENADFSGVMSGLSANAYNTPIIGTEPYQYNIYNRLTGPTTYTHPRSAYPGFVTKGFVKPGRVRASTYAQQYPKSIDPAHQPQHWAPYGSTI